MNVTRLRMYLLLLVLLVVGCDQYTKRLVRERVTRPQSMLGGSVLLVHAENRGAFLSLGSNLPESTRTVIFVAGVSALIVGALVIMWRGAADLRNALPIALIAAGGIGNLIDRATRGAVTDFLVLRAGPLHTGIFNVADMAITTGVIAVFVLSLVRKTERAK
jgi:signal peptidase II